MMKKTISRLFRLPVSIVMLTCAGCGAYDSSPAEPASSTSATLGSGTPVTGADEHLHLMRPRSAQSESGGGLNGVFSSCTLPAHLTSYGGANATSVQVVPVFWGDIVSSTTKSRIYDSLTVMGASSISQWLTSQYRMATWSPHIPITITPHSNPALTTVTEPDIQAELAWQIDHTGVLPGSGPGYLYVVHLPWNVTAKLGALSQCADFCGYNGAYTKADSTKIYYAVMPDFEVECAFKCAGPFTPWYDPFTAAESHEIVEALTDEMGGGWEERSQPSCDQIGDLCSYMTYTTEVNPLGSVAVQMEWSNASNSCRGDTPGAANDMDGDGNGDFALAGGPGWGSVPIGFYSEESGGPTFTGLNPPVDYFPLFATESHTVMGDFDGDGYADLAATGGLGWGSVPVAFWTGTRSGQFNVKNDGIVDFGSLATASGVLNPVAGDFDGDGRSDIALAGGAGWTGIPVAYSNGDGSFTVANLLHASNNAVFEALIQNSTIVPQLLAGDFNGDGRSDLALVGGTFADGSPWTSIPVAFSIGERGVFGVIQQPVDNIPIWSTENAYAVAGDFDADGRADIALTGVSWWGSVPIAYSTGWGTFDVRNNGYGDFAGLAATHGARVIAGDFDGSGSTDLALIGGDGWTNIYVLWLNGRDGGFAFSTLDGSWLAPVAAWSSVTAALGTSDAYKAGGP